MKQPHYLLDTNVISEPLRPAPHPKVLAQLKKHRAHLVLSAVVWHELWHGCQRLPNTSPRRQKIQWYLDEVVTTLPIVAYDQRAAEWHATERARLMTQGKTPPFADSQIAAIAQVNDLILVTFNVADYAFFQDLKIEDWRK